MSTRQHFHEKLDELQAEMLGMGQLVKTAIVKASLSLTKKDILLAKEVIRDDEKINQNEVKIENICAEILATEQPVAIDLRFIISILKTIHELERAGDYATHLAKTTLILANHSALKVHPGLIKMIKITLQMLQSTLSAFTNKDAVLAEKVGQVDEIVDSLYLQVFKDLLKDMETDPEHIKQENALLFVAKFLERMADHIVNISEEVIFLSTGKRKEKERMH